MTKIIVSILALSCFSAAATTPNEAKQNIRRLTDRIYDEVIYTKATLETLQKVEKNLESSLAILRGEDVPPADQYKRSECIKFILDKNFGTATAKQTCDAITTAAEFTCVVDVVEINYSPRTGVASCRGIKKEELACFRDVLARNYSPDRARDLCVSSAEQK
jgi:hypothetical protein